MMAYGSGINLLGKLNSRDTGALSACRFQNSWPYKVDSVRSALPLLSFPSFEFKTRYLIESSFASITIAFDHIMGLRNPGVGIREKTDSLKLAYAFNYYYCLSAPDLVSGSCEKHESSPASSPVHPPSCLQKVLVFYGPGCGDLHRIAFVLATV